MINLEELVKREIYALERHQAQINSKDNMSAADDRMLNYINGEVEALYDIKNLLDTSQDLKQDLQEKYDTASMKYRLLSLAPSQQRHFAEGQRDAYRRYLYRV